MKDILVIELPRDLRRSLEQDAFNLNMSANELAVELIREGCSKILRATLAELMGFVEPLEIDHTNSEATKN